MDVPGLRKGDGDSETRARAADQSQSGRANPAPTRAAGLAGRRQATEDQTSGGIAEAGQPPRGGLELRLCAGCHSRWRDGQYPLDSRKLSCELPAAVAFPPFDTFDGYNFGKSQASRRCDKVPACRLFASLLPATDPPTKPQHQEDWQRLSGKMKSGSSHSESML